MDIAGAFQVTRIKVECCRDERFVKARRVNAKKFFAELRRRNVYKVAIAYAIVAWLLMQVATQVFPFLEIPNWAIRLVIMLIVIGFPIALVIAWAFELTPEAELDCTQQFNPGQRMGTKPLTRFYFVATILALLLPLALHAEAPFNFETTPGKLPKDVVPQSYDIQLKPNIEKLIDSPAARPDQNSADEVRSSSDSPSLRIAL